MPETYPVSGGGFIERDLAIIAMLNARVGAQLSGAPVAGTNAIYTLTTGGTVTGGGIEFEYRGVEATAAWSATNNTFLANVNTALDTLFGAANVQAAIGSMTAGIGTILITFASALALQPVTGLTIDNNLTGNAPTATISNSTPGVRPSGYGTEKGVLIPTNDGLLYQNIGTDTVPVLAAIPQSIEYALTAATLTTGGGVLSVLNPFGVDVIITNAILDIETGSTAANTANFGTGVAANTNADDLYSEVAMNTAGVYSNLTGITGGGINPVLWLAAEFLNGSAVGGTLAGLVGSLHVQVIPR